MNNILLERVEGAGILKINRPQVLNALNLATLGEIKTAIEQMGADTNISIIVITGSGDKAFVAGADIQEMNSINESNIVEFANAGHACMKAIENCPKPVIAAVNGYALGGGTELALACDFIYASDNAKFALPEVKLGIFPGFGGTQRLPRLIGLARAREMIFSGRQISADGALKVGLVNKVVEHARLMEEVISLAKEISANGRLAVGFAKRAINKGVGRDLEEGIEIERAAFADCFATSDRKEGLTAFLEKRKPNFKGK